jgi:hypothetical protein
LVQPLVTTNMIEKVVVGVARGVMACDHPLPMLLSEVSPGQCLVHGMGIVEKEVLSDEESRTAPQFRRQQGDSDDDDDDIYNGDNDDDDQHDQERHQESDGEGKDDMQARNDTSSSRPREASSGMNDQSNVVMAETGPTAPFSRPTRRVVSIDIDPTQPLAAKVEELPPSKHTSWRFGHLPWVSSGKRPPPSYAP